MPVQVLIPACAGESTRRAASVPAACQARALMRFHREDRLRAPAGTVVRVVLVITTHHIEIGAANKRLSGSRGEPVCQTVDCCPTFVCSGTGATRGNAGCGGLAGCGVCC